MIKIGDLKEHDEDEDTIEMGEDTEALTTENRSTWNKGDFRKREYQYGTGFWKIISFW